MYDFQSSQWGTSNGLLLPQQVLKAAGISLGEEVDVVIKPGQILLKKCSPSTFNLREMVARMPRDYQVEEEIAGRPLGREEW